MKHSLRISRISRLVLRLVKFVPPGRSLERSQRNIKSVLHVDDVRVSPSLRSLSISEGESLSYTLKRNVTHRNATCMYTYLKVTVAALRAWRLLHYISSLFLFFF